MMGNRLNAYLFSHVFCSYYFSEGDIAKIMHVYLEKKEPVFLVSCFYIHHVELSQTLLFPKDGKCLVR